MTKRTYKKREAYRECVYMMITDDKYELPIYVTDSIKELADLTGVNRNTISSDIFKGYGRFRKVITEGV